METTISLDNTTINMYLLISLNMPLKYHGSYIRVKKLNYVFENDILRNYTQKYLGVLMGDF